MLKRRLFALGLYLFTALSLYAQSGSRTIGGHISDGTNNLLDGPTISVKGTSVGSISDKDGSFQLVIPETAKALVVTRVGYQSH